MALIPAQITQGFSLVGARVILTSMSFMHAGLTHLLGNMFYLWIFGDNVEDTLGHLRYLLFYLAGGFIASLTHIFLYPTSTVPTVGASGAITAVLGAYLLLFPHRRVVTLIPLGFFIQIARLPVCLCWAPGSFSSSSREPWRWGWQNWAGWLFGRILAASRSGCYLARSCAVENNLWRIFTTGTVGSAI